MSDIGVKCSLFECDYFSILRLCLRKLAYLETLWTTIQRKMFNEEKARAPRKTRLNTPILKCKMREVKLTMAKDPVCGMMVDEKTAKFKSQYRAKTYYFCAQGCKITFDKNPAKFTASQ